MPPPLFLVKARTDTCPIPLPSLFFTFTFTFTFTLLFLLTWIVCPFDYSFVDVPFLFPLLHPHLSSLFPFPFLFLLHSFSTSTPTPTLLTFTHQQTNTLPSHPLTLTPVHPTLAWSSHAFIGCPPPPSLPPSSTLYSLSSTFPLSLLFSRQLVLPLHLGGKNPLHEHTHTLKDTATKHIDATEHTHTHTTTLHDPLSLSRSAMYSFYSFCMSPLLLLAPVSCFRSVTLYPTLFFAIAR